MPKSKPLQNPPIVASVKAKATPPIKPRETTNEPGGQARKVPLGPTEGKGLACICHNGHSSYEGLNINAKGAGAQIFMNCKKSSPINGIKNRNGAGQQPHATPLCCVIVSP